MVDQVVIGFNDPHSAYHSADSIPPGGEDGIRVTCSGGIGGLEHSIVLPDTLYTPRLAQRSPSIAVYASAPAARCIPLASVTGIEPVGHWALEARPFPELTPMILFSGLPAGESDPGVGGRTPFCQFMTGGFRGRTTLDRLIGRLTS